MRGYQPPHRRQSGWQHYLAKHESSQPIELKVDAAEQQVETDNQEHHKQNPCRITLPARCEFLLGPLLALLTARTKQITGLALALLLLDGGVTKLYAALIASLQFGIVVAGVVTKLSRLTAQRLTYSKHMLLRCLSG
jgi:hypothetical protein